MKKLVVYFSMSGNTDYVVNKIKDKIDCDILKLELKKEFSKSKVLRFILAGKSATMGEKPILKDYDFDSKKYNHIIIGSPIWAGTFSSPIKSFIDKNKDKLKSKKISVFLCYSGSDANKALDKLKNELEIDSFDSELYLINPKTKQSKDKDKQIDSFIEKLKK